MESVLQGVPQSLRLWGRLVKFSHSIFALPFALSMLLVVAKDQLPDLHQVFLIILALVSARTAAMAFNRLVDHEIDALNPRTKRRELPAGEISRQGAWMLVLVSAVIFVLSAFGLGRHCLILSPLVLAVLFLYSWTKRFTSWSHFILGLCLAMAPGGVWYALTAEFAFLPVIMMLAVLFWVAGFDILYSCQDIAFDRKYGLQSIPSRLGAERSFQLAMAGHVISILLLAWFGVEAGLKSWYFVGLALFGIVLFSQYTVVSSKDLRRMDAAFFTRNGLASVVFFAGMLLDRILA